LNLCLFVFFVFL